uniref:Uncharacterized protein n=2 Tax=Avena sativa TaxID=4498 RepID=A0ACD5XZC8_AVESA
MPEELNNALYLSYEDLSPCLQQCFLHFSLKPKKKRLTFSEFIDMWISEGFVHGNTNRLEELGSEYYNQLILRNLIEPYSEHPGQYYCNMHDVVHSFAQFVARDEALVAHNGEIANSKLSSQRFLRLSIDTKEEESYQFGWRSLQEQKSLRSIISIGDLKIQSGDSLTTFSSLRTLHVDSTRFSPLIESLHQLKHLRYLAIERCNDIKSLPENIHKMRFLQHISLNRCQNLVELPDNIAMLGELRFLDLIGTCVDIMPRGLCALTNFRTLLGFQAHMDGDWCSLEDLGSLPNLRHAELFGLKNVSASSFATKARLCEKMHLLFIALNCNTRMRNDGLITYRVCEKHQRIIEEVFDELCPPPCIQNVFIGQYFGHRLPIWMVSTATVTLSCLRILQIIGLPFCTQLPDVLCQLPCLEYLVVKTASAIKQVGPEFVQPNSDYQQPSSQIFVGFPRLQSMILVEMGEWEEWEWEENMQAMPALEKLTINVCKLRCIPPGLSFHASSLKILNIRGVNGIQSLEGFASVVELKLYNNPVLTRVSNFPKLQKLEILYCPKVELLQEMSALRRLWLRVSYSEKQLPLYLQSVNPSILLVDRCNAEVLASMALGNSGSEWNKFRHLRHVEAYADDGDIEKKWYLTYTSEPYSIETNISSRRQEFEQS